MKVKNITIGIKSLKQSLKEFATAVEEIKKGNVKKSIKKGVYFVNLEAMRRVLTPKRLELLRMIREKHPKSFYELAHISNRDLKNVQEDVNLMARIGLVILHKAKISRKRVIPSVEYDSLNFHIPVI